MYCSGESCLFSLFAFYARRLSSKPFNIWKLQPILLLNNKLSDLGVDLFVTISSVSPPSSSLRSVSCN